MNQARYALYVDGVLVQDSCMDESQKTIVVFKGDTERDAIVQFLKLSEGTQSYLHLKHRRKASVPTFIPQKQRKPAVPWSSRNS